MDVVHAIASVETSGGNEGKPLNRSLLSRQIVPYSASLTVSFYKFCPGREFLPGRFFRLEAPTFVEVKFRKRRIFVNEKWQAYKIRNSLKNLSFSGGMV